MIERKGERPSKIEEIFEKFDAKEEPKIRIRIVSRDLVINESKIRIETNSIQSETFLTWNPGIGSGIKKRNAHLFIQNFRTVSEGSFLKCFEDEEYLVISSEGKGKGKQLQLRGDCLGMYQWVPEHSHYIQVSTEENPDKTKRMRRYLYQADDDCWCWFVSKDPGKRKGSLKNSSKSSSVPLHSWLDVYDKQVTSPC